MDPTLPGIPQDAIDHAANVERARVLLDNPAPPPLADVYVERVAEALTAAELRGWGRARDVAPPTVAIGTRLRDLTVAQLEALPVGARFEDPADLGALPPLFGFTRTSDGWADNCNDIMTSDGLIAEFCGLLDDYRLAHLPESP